ncbi:MAG: IS1182 family transposase [Syntrophaceae bacterium]|nr:IS1182 family transposase [Syntrophaceae bacterium]
MLAKSDVRFIPHETIRVAKAAFPNGSMAIYLRDAFDGIYTDESFSDLYPQKGQPAEAPWRLALVTVLQFAENLSDRQAAEAVRSRIDWKYALGLELADPGFDHTVLCKFRKRLLEGNAEKRLLDILLDQCREKSLIKKRGSMRTDSTHVLARVKSLSRLGSIFEALRTALNEVARLAPDWLKSWVPNDWYERYSCAYDSFRWPESADKIASLTTQMGEDIFALLDNINMKRGELRDIAAVSVLRQVWFQQFQLKKDVAQMKDAKELVSTSELIASPYDPEARLGNKRKKYWTGYKMHISETCDEDLVHLITHVETAQPNRRDNMQMTAIHDGLKEKEILPSVHFVDSGYMDAGVIVSGKHDYGIEVCGPALLNNQWQSGDYTQKNFKIDWDREKAACPQGKESITWKPTKDRYQNPMIRIYFSSKDCNACASKPLCTKSKKLPRVLGIRGKAEYEALQEARTIQTTQDWKQRYKVRAGVEGCISQGIRAFGLRRSRYIGFEKTHFQHIAIATAMNAVRLHAWNQKIPRSKTRQSRFARLAS